MAWLYLFLAGLLEIAWAMGLKSSNGFSRLWPSVITIICMVVSFGFLSMALKTIPLGTGYAIWTGIGTAGTVILGAFVFGEQVTLGRAFFIILIITGIIGLKVVSDPRK